MERIDDWIDNVEEWRTRNRKMLTIIFDIVKICAYTLFMFFAVKYVREDFRPYYTNNPLYYKEGVDFIRISGVSIITFLISLATMYYSLRMVIDFSIFHMRQLNNDYFDLTIIFQRFLSLSLNIMILQYFASSTITITSNVLLLLVILADYMFKQYRKKRNEIPMREIEEEAFFEKEDVEHGQK